VKLIIPIKNHSIKQTTRILHHYKSYILIPLDHLNLHHHLVDINISKHLSMITVENTGFIYLNINPRQYINLLSFINF